MVLEVGGRDVGDAHAFAVVTGEEMKRLELTGGTLQLEVQADDPRPRNFATPIKSTVEVVANPRDGSGHRDGGKHTGSGGVNVWDRYDNGKKPNPDDPNQ